MQFKRSKNRIIGGVCAGFADHLDMSPARVRLAYGLISLVSAGIPGTLVYLILWTAFPSAEE